jgi:hypothetical protein
MLRNDEDDHYIIEVVGYSVKQMYAPLSSPHTPPKKK